MSQNKIRKDAMAAVAAAAEMLAQATERLRLADRFPVEPDTGTVLMFEKEFPNSQAALEAAGLNFDPNKLLPNVHPAGIEKLAEMMGIPRSAGVVVLDEGMFAEVQRTTYTYVAIRIGAVWYTTAARSNKTMSWDKLVEFIGDSQCWVAETWRKVPVEAPQVIEGDQVAEFDADASATLAGVLSANRRQVMETLRKLRANGGNPTPKTIVDALAKIGAGDK